MRREVFETDVSELPIGTILYGQEVFLGHLDRCIWDRSVNWKRLIQTISLHVMTHKTKITDTLINNMQFIVTAGTFHAIVSDFCLLLEFIPYNSVPVINIKL
jgi:uncharacterized membrane protein